jgi:hypothetical protein
MTDKIDCYSGNQVAPTRVHWLWKPYLARGKLCILDGDPGTGKSFLAIDLAARLSRGGPLPDGQTLNRTHNTVLISAEDHAGDTIRPRLEAAGADLDRIQIVAPGLDTRLPVLPDDFNALRWFIDVARADLIVIDPIMAFLGQGIWANSDQSIRRVFTELSRLAAEYDCAILMIRHLIKTGSWKAIYRGGGSIGMIGACRTGLMAGIHPDDPSLRVLTMTKTNVGSPGKSLAFRLVEGADEGEARVEWLGRADLTATDLCVTPSSAGTRPRDRAKEWLKQQLAEGKKRAAEIETAAKEAGIAQRTLYRAKEDLGLEAEQVRVEKEDRNEWWWHDPEVTRQAELRDLIRPLEEILDWRIQMEQTLAEDLGLASDPKQSPKRTRRSRSSSRSEE